MACGYYIGKHKSKVSTLTHDFLTDKFLIQMLEPELTLESIFGKGIHIYFGKWNRNLEKISEKLTVTGLHF